LVGQPRANVVVDRVLAVRDAGHLVAEKKWIAIGDVAD